MGNNLFHFKQFKINQDKAAMKVGTDGVLIGSWDVEIIPKKILDIGSGTGLLSLMMAQRFPSAAIDAIDIDESAYLQTLENIHHNLPLSKNISCFQSSLQNWKSDKKYDLIICNPPYFEQSIKTESSRNIARQSVKLKLEELFYFTSKLIDSKGFFNIILPAENKTKAAETALENGFYLNKICFVKSNPEKSPKRILLSFSVEKNDLKTSEMVIENNGRHQYSNEYIEQTKDFYLFAEKH
jgi:tRNA1Val (adenine37-N6)-methyltransferase